MTKKELIEILKQFDDNLPIAIHTYCCDCRSYGDYQGKFDISVREGGIENVDHIFIEG